MKCAASFFVIPLKKGIQSRLVVRPPNVDWTPDVRSGVTKESVDFIGKGRAKNKETLRPGRMSFLTLSRVWNPLFSPKKAKAFVS